MSMTNKLRTAIAAACISPGNVEAVLQKAGLRQQTKTEDTALLPELYELFPPPTSTRSIVQMFRKGWNGGDTLEGVVRLAAEVDPVLWRKRSQFYIGKNKLALNGFKKGEVGSDGRDEHVIPNQNMLIGNLWLIYDLYKALYGQDAIDEAIAQKGALADVFKLIDGNDKAYSGTPTEPFKSTCVSIQGQGPIDHINLDGWGGLMDFFCASTITHLVKKQGADINHFEAMLQNIIGELHLDLDRAMVRRRPEDNDVTYLYSRIYEVCGYWGLSAVVPGTKVDRHLEREIKVLGYGNKRPYHINAIALITSSIALYLLNEYYGKEAVEDAIGTYGYA